MCVQLSYNLSALIGLKLVIAYAQVVYIQYSVTLISITFLFVTIDCYQCLMILIVAVCMGFNIILKFILSLFYVLHLNTSLRLAYYKHVEKTLPPYGL